MNAAVYLPPSYKLSASAFTLAVHLLFFALLYFSFAWQSHPTPRPTPVMNVELWQQLSTPTPRPKVITPPPKDVVPPPVEVTEVPPPPVTVVKPDIVIPKEEKPAPKPAVKKVEPEKKKIKPTLGKIEPILPTVVTPRSKPVLSKIEQRLEQRRAEQATARQRLVDEYIGKIIAKIRRNIVMPPTVADDARAVFSVTLLPGGLVLTTRLAKSSGNSAYDNATERAIKKSEPLPLPPDKAMFNDFRNLELNFTPKE